jgi:hypothetical protein
MHRKAVRRLEPVKLDSTMTKRGIMQLPYRSWGIASLAVVLLVPLGCAFPNPQKEPNKPVVAPRIEEPRPLEIGDSKSFTFAADGIWYPAPFVIYRGQRMHVTFMDNLMPCPTGAVRYRIGQLEQILVAEPTEFMVTRPGPMLFYFDPARGSGFRGEINVTVTRVS